ncbi:MAG: type 4a pilus biogenesis protein PilO [Clostridia bacterium]|nr:type 4a pilus biogenesis protein PilO [Ruminococcus sp.]MBR0540674.1 type 4a pilus biogenesis protein PilO [Clostridia bacterium]
MALSDVIKKKQETGESSAKAKEKTSILDDVRIVIAIIVVASIALIALIVYTTGLINEKIVEIDKAKQTYANNQTKIEGLLSLQAQSEQFKDQKEKYDAMISTDGLDQRQIMIDLEKEVESYNCRLNSLTFGEQSNTGLVNQISVNINITGDYTDIMRYCRDVVTGEKIRRIDTINMSPYASSDTKEADIVIVEFSR